MWLNLQLAQLLVLKDPKDSAFALGHCHTRWGEKWYPAFICWRRNWDVGRENYPRPHNKSTGEPRLDLPLPAHAHSHILRPNLSFTHLKRRNLNTAFAPTFSQASISFFYSFCFSVQNYLFPDHQQCAVCWFSTWRVLGVLSLDPYIHMLKF